MSTVSLLDCEDAGVRPAPRTVAAGGQRLWAPCSLRKDKCSVVRDGGRASGFFGARGR